MLLSWCVLKAPGVQRLEQLLCMQGVLSPEDAHMGVQAGADGIIVSNHGGRQLDYAPASLDALPGIAAAVGKRVPVLMDGGIRRGTDIIKVTAQCSVCVTPSTTLPMHL